MSDMFLDVYNFKVPVDLNAASSIASGRSELSICLGAALLHISLQTSLQIVAWLLS